MPTLLTRRLETFGFYSNRVTAAALTARIRAASHLQESLHLLPPLGLPFIPQTSFALSASAIRIVLNDVVLHQRRYVLELGSGMSTLYLSKILSERPGSLLISVDHDAGWLALVADMLKKIGTQDVVRLVHAPLTSDPSTSPAPWYDRPAIEASLGDRPIDALLVDGPKARSMNDPETRFPAVPVLSPRLNPAGAVVFLDDVNRAGEQAILERWSREFGLDCVADAEFCGLGMLVPRATPLRFKIV